MKKQAALADQLAQIDVHCPSEAVPTRQAFFFVALDVPQRIADVLKIEFDSAFQQPGPLAAPVAEQMAAGLVAVRPTQRLLLSELGKCGNHKNARAQQQKKRLKSHQALASNAKKLILAEGAGAEGVGHIF